MAIRALLTTLEHYRVPITSSQSVRPQVVFCFSCRHPIHFSNMRLYANAAICNWYNGATVLWLFYRLCSGFIINIPPRANFRHCKSFCHVRCDANGLRRLESVLRRSYSNALSNRSFRQTSRIGVRGVELYLFRGLYNFRRNFHVFTMCLGNSKAFFVASIWLLHYLTSDACRYIAQCGFDVCRIHSRLFTRRTRDQINRIFRKDGRSEVFSRICVIGLRVQFYCLLFVVRMASSFHYGGARGDLPLCTFVYLASAGGCVFCRS